MKTLSHEGLHCRPFGSALLDVGHFTEWLATKRFRCPIALPAAYVQVEWLLAAIQRHTEDSVTHDEAREIVLASDRLRSHRCADSNPVWLLGGEAYIQWRALVQSAVNSGELVLLDFASKLPMPAALDNPGAPDCEEDVQPWIARARTMAASMLGKDLAAGCEPKKRTVAAEIARLFASDGTRSKQDKPIDADYIERHALQKWGDIVVEEKRKLCG